MGVIEHRRRRFPWWQCTCGRRWPCARLLDIAGREPLSGGIGIADKAITQAGWTTP